MNEGSASGHAAAKVNLRLRVFGRERDGYHSLETLFLRTSLCDEVRVEPGPPGVSLELHGDVDGVPGGPENLCWKAALGFAAAAGIPPAATVHLKKRIPPGAGLGGGSADAATVLRLLNRLHGDPVEDAELLKLAGDLGSDVPFALTGAAAALAWGRGQRLLAVPAPPARPGLLLVPEAPVSTVEAYGWLDEDRSAGRTLPDVEALRWRPEDLADWERLAELAHNDFEPPVLRRRPEIAAWKDRLEGTGPQLARLTGSGSALFAVFRDAGARDAAAGSLHDPAAAEGARLYPVEIPAPAD